MAGGFNQYSSASGRAVGALILSICGFLFCCTLASLPGAILGWMEINAIKQGKSSPNGMRFAVGAVACGIIGTIATVLFYGFYFLAAISAGLSEF